jgi:hypothetical protein
MCCMMLAGSVHILVLGIALVHNHVATNAEVDNFAVLNNQ